MIDPTWFEGDGWWSVVIAALFFGSSALVVLWLRGPGSRPHDPPVAGDRVRWFAVALTALGILGLVRAVFGIGGSVVVSSVVLIISLIVIVRARARPGQSHPSSSD